MPGRIQFPYEAREVQRLGDLRHPRSPTLFGGLDRDALKSIETNALGDRPLGIQASQVAATARWLQERNAGPVEILADGENTGLAALVAAALEPKLIAGVTVRHA